MPDIAFNPFAFPLPLLLSALFAALLCMQMLVQCVLLLRQVRHVAQHRHQVPAALAEHVSAADHARAADYTLAKARLSLLEIAWGAALLLGWTLLGGLDALQAAIMAMLGGGNSLAAQVAVLAAFALLGTVLGWPFDLYRTFVLEQRFGFNTTTPVLWIMDALRGLLLACAIGLPFLWALLWLMRSSGALWWLWAWLAWTALQVLLMLVWPLWLAPLFNRFTALEDQALRDRLTALMRRCHFSARGGLFVMDGSRRSAHANAYFTGLGASRRVVLFDTLLKRLTPQEIEAVLAHELGHFHHRHITRRLWLGVVGSLAALALLGWLYTQPHFYAALGVRPSTALAFGQAPQMEGVALALFVLVLPLLTFWLTPLAAFLSRRDEFQADAYACAHSNGAALAGALIKLHADNASTLTPDPLYAAFYYSHPSALQRLQCLPAPALASSAPAVLSPPGGLSAGAQS